MMDDFFEKILNKPKSYRRKLVYIITSIFGIIIFSLWMIMTIDNFQKTVGEVEVENLKKEVPSLKEKYQKELNEDNLVENLENLGL
jgi:sugar phosphate permease